MRVAVVAGPAPGHLFPAAALACALRDLGHDVLVLTGRPWVDVLREREGLQAGELDGLAPSRSDADAGYRLWGRAGEMTPAATERLRSWQPDVVVSDTLTVAGGWAAASLGLPWVELVPHPLQDLSRDLPPPGTALAAGRGPLGRGRDAVLRHLTARSVALGHEQRRAASAGLGLPPDPRPVLRLVATLPALEPPRSDWPADAEVVGPLVWDPVDVDLPVPEGPSPGAPLVVLSASTAPAALGGPDLLEVAVAALRDEGVRLVATRLGPAPAGLPPWAVAGAGRQAPLLARAALLVGGAGHGTVAKGLVAGLPLVLVPGGGDQRENAGRARRLGAAVVLRPRSLDATRLRAAVRRALADRSLAAASRRAGETSAGLGPERAARRVEDVARDGGRTVGGQPA